MEKEIKKEFRCKECGRKFRKLELMWRGNGPEPKGKLKPNYGCDWCSRYIHI